ncbi:hypothetical protein BESB_063110 [Besnoitia besnoiti]|uniref:Transmembrane protein n=1 Tax=Besnoitia besnoiti TaxID=94643 RepID=A0A2A9ME02_BESBE|nr:hypothetical protein BESB_063110 [Besnoitia besnoiti]PFH35424.1 hypothetical protein BESB_063110 [Besnoitia besnoiti]
MGPLMVFRCSLPLLSVTVLAFVLVLFSLPSEALSQGARSFRTSIQTDLLTLPSSVRHFSFSQPRLSGINPFLVSPLLELHQPGLASPPSSPAARASSISASRAPSSSPICCVVHARSAPNSLAASLRPLQHTHFFSSPSSSVFVTRMRARHLGGAPLRRPALRASACGKKPTFAGRCRSQRLCRSLAWAGKRQAPTPRAFLCVLQTRAELPSPCPQARQRALGIATPRSDREGDVKNSTSVTGTDACVRGAEAARRSGSFRLASAQFRALRQLRVGRATDQSSPTRGGRAFSAATILRSECVRAGAARREVLEEDETRRRSAETGRCAEEARRGARRGLGSFEMNVAPPGTAFEAKVAECRDNPIDTMPWEHVVPFYKVHKKEDNFWLQFLKGNWTYVDARKMLDKPAGLIDGGPAVYDGLGTTLPMNPLAKDRQREKAFPQHLDHGVRFREAVDRPHRIIYDRIPCGNSDVYYGETDIDLEERLWGAFHHTRATEEGFPDSGWRDILPQYDMSEMPNPWTHTKGEFIEMPYNSRDPSAGPPVAPIEFDLAAAGRFGGYFLDPGWTRHFDYVEQYNEMKRWQEDEAGAADTTDEAPEEGEKKKRKKQRKSQLLDKPMFREAYERGQLLIKSRYEDIRNHPVYKKAIYEGATHEAASIAANRATEETIVDMWRGIDVAADLPKVGRYDHEGGGKWNCEDGEGQTIAINMFGEDIVPHANCYMSPKMTTEEMAELWHYWMTESHREGRYTDFHSEIGCYSDIEYEDRNYRKKFPRLMALYRPLWTHRKFGDEFGDALRPDEAPSDDVLTQFGAPLMSSSRLLRRAAARVKHRGDSRPLCALSVDEDQLFDEAFDFSERDASRLRRARLSRHELSRLARQEGAGRLPGRGDSADKGGALSRAGRGLRGRRQYEAADERGGGEERRPRVDSGERDAEDRRSHGERRADGDECEAYEEQGETTVEENDLEDQASRWADSPEDAQATAEDDEAENEDLNFLDEYDDLWWFDRGRPYGATTLAYRGPAVVADVVHRSPLGGRDRHGKAREPRTRNLNTPRLE